MTQRLTDMSLTRVSVVDKGANARRFAVLKRDEEGEMTDPVAAAIAKATPDEARTGVLAWIAKALGLSAPVAKAAMPADAAAMGAHLAAAAPGGHGKAAAEGASMAAMTTQHDAMHAAGADHSHAVAKAAQTFASMVAGQELRDALYDSWYTLEDAIWSALYATDSAGQALPLEAKKALVTQDLEEFTAYLLAQMDSGVSKRDGGPAEAATRHVAAVVAKAGRKISGARLERLSAAAEALNSVLAEVADQTETGDAQEDDVEKAELIEAITKANEPLVARLDALEKAAKPAEPVVKTEGEGGEEGGELTLEGVAQAVLSLQESVEKIAKARGERQSQPGQDGSGQVKKSVFAGVF